MDTILSVNDVQYVVRFTPNSFDDTRMNYVYVYRCSDNDLVVEVILPENLDLLNEVKRNLASVIPNYVL